MASRGTNLSITSIGLGILIVVGAAVWFGFGPTADPPQESVSHESADPVSSDIHMTVHVSGSVRLPGVVVVPTDARIADAVLAAGGATSDADLGRVNLAASVRDGDHIVIPGLVTGLPDGAAPIDLPFDINTASPDELEELPGVGPVLAARIVTYREDHGPFDSIEDLLDVPGIGESKLAAIRDFVESG